ncbi:MAG: prepilin-type N-terminal cleavage/methylation domain-containing protein [Bryobacterales bacterium]|nr:prepilin-type N-terminal cleavage/methylation domain-containing protein [Bryobacterales bacterium]
MMPESLAISAVPLPPAAKPASRGKRPAQAGFTLLEALVATLIMAIAVVGLLSAISTSLGNAARLSEHDQISLLAKRKMEDLLVAPMPLGQPFSGQFAPAEAAGREAGWSAVVYPFEGNAVGQSDAVLDRMVLEVWWNSNGKRRTLQLETFRARRLLDAGQIGRYPRG